MYDTANQVKWVSSVWSSVWVFQTSSCPPATDVRPFVFMENNFTSPLPRRCSPANCPRQGNRPVTSGRPWHAFPLSFGQQTSEIVKGRYKKRKIRWKLEDGGTAEEIAEINYLPPNSFYLLVHFLYDAFSITSSTLFNSIRPPVMSVPSLSEIYA